MSTREQRIKKLENCLEAIDFLLADPVAVRLVIGPECDLLSRTLKRARPDIVKELEYERGKNQC